MSATLTTSKASAAERWLTDLPESTAFTVDQMPSTNAAASRALNRLAAADDPMVSPIGRGYWWKGYVAEGQWQHYPLPVATAIAHLGPGCGWAGLSALNALRWTNQIPARQFYAGVAPTGTRLPTPLLSGCYYRSRANVNRRDLTWWEVTMLEGLRDFWVGQRLWENVLAEIAARKMTHSHRDGTLFRWFRPAALVWGAEGEPPAIREDMQQRVAEIAARLPATPDAPWPDPASVPPTDCPGWVGPAALAPPQWRQRIREGFQRDEDWWGCR